MSMGKTRSMEINGKKVFFEDGETVLNVAQKAGIFIPTLCSRPDLPSWGACRLCIVEVDGIRGYPSSCTLPATEGMIVRTMTPDVQTVRRNTFQLILSEHPSSCLTCKNAKECDALRIGEFKAGRVIGCNTCSAKDHCEIRKLAEYFRIREITVPSLYKNLPLERFDPFLIRDYNLCILCNRCVRACQDVLGHSAIAITKRGHDTKIGTILEVSHVESGCIFCGHCIDVCPTGSLTARNSRWASSNPEVTVATSCILCSHNCQMIVEEKWNKVVNVHPEMNLSARREYCVKGRFCIPSLVNARERLKYPTIKRGDIQKEMVPVDWDEALDYTVANLKKYKPEEIVFFLSPHMLDEAIFVFQSLAKQIANNQVVYSDDDLREYLKKGVKAIYTTEQSIVLAEAPYIDFVILQDIFTSKYQELANVVLPTVTFTEETGTKTGIYGMRTKVNRSAKPPGLSKPDWVIGVEIAKKFNISELSYSDLDTVQDDLFLHGNLEVPLVPKESLFYRGIPIASKVQEFRNLIRAQQELAESQGVKFVAKF